MEYYIGLDLSQRQTSICIVDEKGKLVAQGKSLTQPADVRGWLEARQIDFSSIVRVGLEAGAMSGWRRRRNERSSPTFYCTSC